MIRLIVLALLAIGNLAGSIGCFIFLVWAPFIFTRTGIVFLLFAIPIYGILGTLYADDVIKEFKRMKNGY